jgi:choline dehydrogenase
MTELSANVIIVGGGTAGCVLASRLSEDPARTVILVEAGVDVSADRLPDVVRYSRYWLPYDLRYMWSYAADMYELGVPARTQLRGKVLGGSSSVNGAIAVRGIARDYDAWNIPLWSYSEVLPSFKRLESDQDFSNEFHGADGPISIRRFPQAEWSPFATSFAEALAELGFDEKPDLNHPHGVGYGALPFSLRPGGERTSTASAYIDPARSRANLTVIAEATAEEVLFAGCRAIGVVVSGSRGRRRILADEVVLACGAFETPKLLMLSGIGEPALLNSLGITVRSALPGVGQNLRCHPGLRSLSEASSPRMWPAPGHDFHVGLFFDSSVGTEESDMQLLARQVGSQVGFLCSVRVPESVGSVQLRSTDPTDAPEITYGVLADLDRARLTRGAELIRQLMGTPALAWALSDEFTERSGTIRNWIGSHITAPFHACGTCRMGDPNDPLAVVDPLGQVMGVENLRICDVSIMPQSVRGGPYASAMMVGERASELMTGREH